jgi:hypothetical protein
MTTNVKSLKVSSKHSSTYHIVRLVNSILILKSKANIQENLEDQFVQEALSKGLDLRKYSKEVELDLTTLERSSIKDCKFGIKKTRKNCCHF